MKRVKINHVTDPDRSGKYTNSFYRVSIGLNNSRVFKSKREAYKYLAYINKELNLILHEVNYLYAVLFYEYRQVWFYLFNYQSDKKQILYEIEMFCRKEFNLIDELMNKITRRTGKSVNDNYFIPEWLNILISSEIKISDQLQKLSELKKLYISTKKFQIFNSQALELQKKLNEIGKKSQLPGQLVPAPGPPERNIKD